MKLKTICFDIDNVVCKTNAENDYSKSKPIKKNIKVINETYKKGFNIILYTARYMGRCNGNLAKVEKKIKPLTVKQLKKWGVQYHELILFKPSYDIFIDDKSLSFNSSWTSHLLKELKIKNI